MSSTTHITGLRLEKLEIPAELWIEIIRLIDPPDMLSLFQTCRYLYGISSRRDVWIHALRSLCVERGLFLPTYPTDTMDLPHLQRVTMGPYLWSKKMAASHATPGAMVNPLSTLDVELPEVSVHGTEHYLVPGGRFLVTCDHNNLHLWDLGVPGIPTTQATTPPVLIARCDVGDEDDFALDSFSLCVVEGRKLRIGIVSLSEKAKVYEISPDDDEPAFHLVSAVLHAAHLEEHQYGWGSVIHGDRLLFHTIDHRLVVWDYISGRYIVWAIDISFSQWYEDRIVFTGDLVLLMSPDCIKAWIVPTPDQACVCSSDPSVITDTYMAQGDRDRAPSPPDCTIPMPFHHPGYSVSSTIPSDWGASIGQPLVFDVFYFPNGSANSGWHLNMGCRYRLDVTARLVEPRVVDLEVKLLKSFGFPGPNKHRQSHKSKGPRTVQELQSSCPIATSTVLPAPILAPQHGGGGGFGFRSPPPQKMNCCVYSIDGGDSEDIDWDTMGMPVAFSFVNLTIIHEVAARSTLPAWSLCSSSGRLVYLDRYHGNETPTLFVGNYLY